MFLTAQNFNTYYDVDSDIARYFVDRRVPAHNLYWKNRTIYLPSAPGYIFIPIYFDLLLRSGADKTELLNNHSAEVSEFILNSAARLESKQIRWKEHIEEIQNHLLSHIQRKSFYDSVSQYLFQEKPIKQANMDLGTAYPSLNRADSYLFLLSALQSPSLKEAVAVDAWYALMTYFLILDDLSDIKEDLQNQEENVLIDAGINQQGIHEINSMLSKSIEVLAKVNPILSERLEKQKNLIDLDTLIQSIRSST